MKKEIKIIDNEKKIIRITTLDERWYARPEQNQETGLPEFRFYPSSTWIAGHYPKGIAFYKWLASKGWDEAEAIKVSAGERGTRIHRATEILENNGFFDIETELEDPEGQKKQLNSEEIEALKSFADWHNETKPDLTANEHVIFGEDYAGTLDRIYRINGTIWLVDLKTSQSIWEEYILQLSSYSHAEILDLESLKVTAEEWAARKLAILQIGYQRNKARWKWTPIEDKYDLFRMARAIWANENPDAKPKQRDLPLVITLNKETAPNG